MKKNLFLLLCTLIVSNSFAQQGYYIYLQSEDRQPFYAKLSNKLYPSSENGYLIIPRLGDSTYLIIIGFSKNAFPEQSFSVSINKKDKGFQLKNFFEKGWGLINVQTTGVTMNAGLPAKASEEITGTKKADAFSELLANVVNDSAILYTVVKPTNVALTGQTSLPGNSKVERQNKEEQVDSSFPNKPVLSPENGSVKPDIDSLSIINNTTKASTRMNSDSLASPANERSVSVNNDTVNAITKEFKSVASDDDKPFISKIYEKLIEGTYQATYLEQYNLRTDTIRISIPFEDGANFNQPSITDKPAAPERKEKALNAQDTLSTTGSVTAQPPARMDTLTTKSASIQITNSDCKNFASDNDLDKIRVKILKDEAIDDKLVSAKKYFRTKCFSVKQIKALSELFPSDETKMRFFDVAYPFVSDTGSFYLLEDLLGAPLYKDRFKAMLNK